MEAEPPKEFCWPDELSVKEKARCGPVIVLRVDTRNVTELGGDDAPGQLNPNEFQCLQTHAMASAATVAVLMGEMMGCRVHQWISTQWDLNQRASLVPAF